jgi:hypothetical protein
VISEKVKEGRKSFLSEKSAAALSEGSDGLRNKFAEKKRRRARSSRLLAFPLRGISG